MKDYPPYMYYSTVYRPAGGLKIVNILCDKTEPLCYLNTLLLHLAAPDGVNSYTQIDIHETIFIAKKILHRNLNTKRILTPSEWANLSEQQRVVRGLYVYDLAIWTETTVIHAEHDIKNSLICFVHTPNTSSLLLAMGVCTSDLTAAVHAIDICPLTTDWPTKTVYFYKLTGNITRHYNTDTDPVKIDITKNFALYDKLLEAQSGTSN